MLSTKDVKAGGGSSLPKIIQPGNHKVKINKVELEDFKFKPGAVNLLLHMEGEDLGEDFQGFFINKDNESLGRYKGQVARVKAGEWAFADGQTKSGIEVSRDMEILRFLKNLCLELNCLNWFEDQDGKHGTIQSLVEAFNNDKPFANKWLNVCIAGKEYMNKEGYTSYDLFLPKFSKSGVPFEGVGKAKSRVMTFKESEHIKKKAVENVSGFGAEGGNEGAVDSAFKL